MAIKYLTVEEHQKVLEQLVGCARQLEGCRYHQAGPEYTSLMVCFLLHNMAAAESLLRLRNSFTNEWFPTTIGYLIARSMFETEVTAHYIARSPAERSRQYVEFGRVLRKREMDACHKHRKNDDPQWREAMDLVWRNVWAGKELQINIDWDEVRARFEKPGKRGKSVPFRNWSGKSIREMAMEVDHEASYDVFYAELSSFAHTDVRLADRYLRIGQDGLSWSQRASEFDVGNVFRHSVSFMTCFMNLFAECFSVWSEEDVQRCWIVEREL